MDTSPGTRPRCECHGIEMWVAHAARNTWRCAVKLTEYRSTEEHRQRMRDYYSSKSWRQINRALLLGRRRKALKRMAERNARGEV
jgi:hypothetical protein